MTLKEIKEGLPIELMNQIMGDEKVYYFSYISFKGGCLSSSPKEEYSISATNKRVIYKAKIQEEAKKRLLIKSGILPLDKKSFIEVTDVEEKGSFEPKSRERMVDLPII